MSTQKSRRGRQTQGRRFLLQILATISFGFGTAVIAGETKLAFYTVDLGDEEKGVITLPADEENADAFDDILQVQATILQIQARVLQQTEPTPDGSLPSSSDVLAEEDFQLPRPLRVTDPFGDDAADAAIELGLVPIPVEQMPKPAEAENLSASATARSARCSAATSYLYAPAMIGDFFGGSFLLGSGQTVPLAGGDRRFKVAENVSPIPRDRVLFNYNHFHNALTDINGVSRNLDRFTFGIEKTFWRGRASIETRLPLASGLDSRQNTGLTDTRSTELGNLAFAFKATVASSCNWMISAGTSMTIPTGDDYVQFNGAAPELEIQNDAVHLAPFVGFVAQPKRCWFTQGFIQADIDLGGNDVFTDTNGFEGVLQDQNLLFIDASVGRWVYLDPCHKVSGVAAIAELHYTTTLNDTDSVAGVANPFNRMDILNATGALDFQVGKASMRLGGAAPLTNNEERLFDAEIIAQINRHY